MMEARYEVLRRATEEVAAVDAHAHNLVEHGSAFPFLRCFSEAEGDALALAPHSLSFKVRCHSPLLLELPTNSVLAQLPPRAPLPTRLAASMCS